MFPSLFLCHGAPTLALEDQPYTRFLNQLSGDLGKPEGIIVFSAHWEKERTTVTCRDDIYDTIHDFYGFPEELYRMQYPARGSSDLSGQIQSAFEAAQCEVSLDTERGLDHGVWVLLNHLYPDADIPVVAVSINPLMSPEEQYRIGRALSGLREQNMLVLGSGATVHNLRRLEWGSKDPAEWAVAFDDWLLDHVNRWDLDALFDYRTQAPYAREAVPTAEHLVPLFITMGSGDDVRKSRVLHRSYQYGSLSMIGILIE
ncbi:MAG: dioxygenase [Bacillaceae bacterium]|nr:dioxygenase [Bacillaceae bacterium]